MTDEEKGSMQLALEAAYRAGFNDCREQAVAACETMARAWADGKGARASKFWVARRAADSIHKLAPRITFR